MGGVLDGWAGIVSVSRRWKKVSSRTGPRRCRQGSCHPLWKPLSSCSRSSSPSLPRNKACVKCSRPGTAGSPLQPGSALVLLPNLLCMVFLICVSIHCGSLILFSISRNFYFLSPLLPVHFLSFKIYMLILR